MDTPTRSRWLLPPLFLTRSGRQEVQRAREVLRDPNVPQGRLSAARAITRRNFLDLLTAGGLAAGGLGTLGYSVLRDNDVRSLTPGKRTTRFMQIGDALEEQGYGKVEWRHPASGPRDPIFVRSFTHENVDGSLPAPNHIPILVQEFRSAIFACEHGLRQFAVEGERADTCIPPMIFLVQHKMFRGDAKGIPIYPGRFTEVTDEEKRQALAAHPDMNIASSEECQWMFSQEGNMTSLFQANAHHHFGTRFGNILAASLPKSARVTGLEDPAEQEAFGAFYADHVKTVERANTLVSAIARDFSVEHQSIALDVHYDGQRKITAVQFGDDVFPIDEFVRSLQVLRDLHLPPEEPFHRKREAYITNTLDAHMAFFGADHLDNFRAMQHPPRSLGIVAPTLPYFDPAARRSWHTLANEMLRRVREEQNGPPMPIAEPSLLP